jgi:diaminopimelate decarboxylase
MSLDVLGPRVRPVGSGSRFGCSVERPSELLTLVRAVDALPSNTALGLHLHLAASTVGTAGWRRALSGVLEIAVGLDVSSRPVEVIDLGGGCTPGQLDRMLGEFDGVISQLTDALPSLRVVLLEPGKAILQPAAAVFTRVLEVRDGFSGRDVVVDASIAELPQALLGPHPVMWHNRHWWQARRGSDRVLGRLCMEADVLADGVGLPDALAVGESLVLGLAGAYDMSMSYEFGRG